MSSLLKIPIRLIFFFMSKKKVLAMAETIASEYSDFATLLGSKGSVSYTVPKMIGVDEDMRNWSFFQLLEHNTIVNRAMTDLICDLAAGDPPEDREPFDPKNDVMPSSDSGPEQVSAFEVSVQDHISRVSALSDLRKTARYRHPMFGMFTAHQWSCMFSFHLKVHLRQARLLAENA